MHANLSCELGCQVYGLLGVKTLEESVIMSQAEIARAAGVARTSPRRIAAQVQLPHIVHHPASHPIPPWQAVALRDVSPMRAGITFRGSSVPSSPAASPGKVLVWNIGMEKGVTKAYGSTMVLCAGAMQQPSLAH